MPDKKAIEERLSWRVGVSSVRLGEIMRGCSAVFLRIVIIYKHNWEKMNTFFFGNPMGDETNVGREQSTWEEARAKGKRLDIIGRWRDDSVAMYIGS